MRCTSSCPLSARSGHSTIRSDDLVGAGQQRQRRGKAERHGFWGSARIVGMSHSGPLRFVWSAIAKSSKKVIGGFAPQTPKSQRVKASRNNERPADPEAHGVIPVIGIGPVAEGRADVLRPAAPGTAADDAGGAISTSPR